MREKAFENQVKDFLSANGCWYVKYWGGGIYTKEGVPDLLICCNGHFLGIELKNENGKATALQYWNIEQILTAGGFAMVLYPKDFEKFKKLIRDLLKRATPTYAI